jgi:hypothetical protein
MARQQLTVRLSEVGQNKKLHDAIPVELWLRRLLREDSGLGVRGHDDLYAKASRSPPSRKAGRAPAYDPQYEDEDADAAGLERTAAGNETSSAYATKMRLERGYSEDEDFGDEDARMLQDFKELLRKHRREGGGAVDARPQAEARRSYGYSPGNRSRRVVED